MLLRLPMLLPRKRYALTKIFLRRPGRMTFAAKMAETRLAGLKAVEPKLQAFYDSLDAKQKKAFDTGGRIGGIFDW
jgi:LTXXQ motif family protein